MKNILLILILLLIGLVGFLLLQAPEDTSENIPPVVNDVEEVDVQQEITPIPDEEDDEILQTLLLSSGVVQDPMNPGVLVVTGSYGYCLLGTECQPEFPYPFQIEYHKSDRAFYTILLYEPLAEARIKADEYLMNLLEISPSELCELNSHVAVPSWVSDNWAGVEIGHSGCPDAVDLSIIRI